MHGRHLPGAFRPVGGKPPVAIDGAKSLVRKSFRCFERVPLPLWIDGAKHEQTISHDRRADGGSSVIEPRRHLVDRPLYALHRLMVGFETVGTCIAKDAAPEH